MAGVLPMRGSAPTKDLTGVYNGSPKIDGIRAIVKDGVVLSKSLKPIRNKQIQEKFGHLHGADGELAVGLPYSNFPGDKVFKRSSGIIMTGKDIEPAEVNFYMFDNWEQCDEPYVKRIESVSGIAEKFAAGNNSAIPGFAFVVPQVWVSADGDPNMLSVDYYEQFCLEKGFEGVMLRDPESTYKYGKATPNDRRLIKIKRFANGEALILDVVEQQRNENEAYTSSDGSTKRSSAKDGKVGKDTFGSFILSDVTTKVVFRCGTGRGLTDDVRAYLWSIKDKLPGKYITYVFQQYGTDVASRIPIWTGFRDVNDISEVAGL